MRSIRNLPQQHTIKMTFHEVFVKHCVLFANFFVHLMTAITVNCDELYFSWPRLWCGLWWRGVPVCGGTMYSVPPSMRWPRWLWGPQWWERVCIMKFDALQWSSCFSLFYKDHIRWLVEDFVFFLCLLRPFICTNISHDCLCSCVCAPGEFQCRIDQCVPADRVCDGTKDCPSGSDEAVCPSKGTKKTQSNIITIHPSIYPCIRACMHACIHLSILFTLSGVQGCGCARVYPIPYLSYTLESLPIYHRCSNMKDVTMTTLIFFWNHSHSVLLTSSLESSGCV